MRTLSRGFRDLAAHPAEDRPVALIFPFAGGNAHSVKEWGDRLPGHRAIGVQYPGHGPRSSEPFAESVDDLCRGLLVEYFELFTAPPALLLGHSMGALAALETALALDRRGTGPGVLVVSSAAPPGTISSGDGPLSDTRHGLPLHELHDDALAAALVAAGGLPAELLEEPELVALTLPAVRHDFRLGAEYAHPADQVLSCPLIAIGGQDDPAVPPEVLRAWAPLTTSSFDTRTWPGGHFYFRSDLPGLEDLVRSAPVPAGGEPSSSPTAGADPAKSVEREVLAAVLDVWRELLPATTVTPQTRFFAAGGTSIAAMRGCSKLSAALGVRVPVKILLDHGRLEDFAARVAELRRAAP